MIAEDNRDRFPEGMRVLAVDDDPTCLKFLEALLRKCNYHVTVTNQAIKALEMLRENRNKYDLVISDVNMPDMDGFKLLELLGLEMDLPVIMLSGYSDVQLVMKGIDHGACDYMLKPVRLEELKNIWQHVVRKKKSSNQDKASNGTVEGGKRTSPTGCSDQNVNLRKKRKDQDRDEEEEEYSEDDDENEDSSSQKRRRVIWTGDLHRKFLAAVSQLKEEDVVPKKILDLMEVKEITRENVASHLQKYRQGLRKMKNGMVASFGGNESSYLQSLRSGRMSSSTLSTYTSGGMFCGLNSPSGLSTVGMTSSSLGQPGYSQILSSYNNRFAKLQPITASPSQGAHLFQMTAALSKLNSLEQSKCISHSGKSYPDADLAKYRLLSTFRDAGVSSSSLPSGSKFPSNPLFLGIPQQKNSIGVFGNPTSVKVSSGIGISGSSNILDYNWPSENVQGAAQLSSFPISASATSHGQMNTSNMAACFILPQIGNTLNGISSVSALSASVGESRGNVQNQEGLIGDVVPTLNYMPKKMWEEHKPGYNHEPNQPFSATSTPHFTSGIDGLVIPRVDQHDAACNYEKGPSFHDDRLNGANALFAQPSEASKFSTEKQVKPNEDYFLEQPNSPTGFLDNNHESFEDIMNTLTEREKNENVDSLLDAEFGFDAHSLGSFM